MGNVLNVKIEPVEVEWNSSGLGLCDGDIELTFDEQATEIGAHQEGTNILDAIRTGMKVEFGVTLKETSMAQLKHIFGGMASSFTPSGGTEVLGFGSAKDFTALSAQAAKLVLHPVVLGASDKSRDLAIWKAYPMVDKMTFSGEKEEMISVKFKIFPDTTKKPAARMVVIGDHSQNFAV